MGALLGILFVVSGATKLQSPVLFFASLLEAGILSPNAAFILAHFLPWLELVLGGWGILGMGRREFGFAASALLMIFTAYLLLVFEEGRPLECGCFGALDAGIPVGFALGRNFALIAVAMFVAWADPKSEKKDLLS
jgi:putative oxidoreductase